MQSHNPKKQQFVTAPGRYHTGKGYPQYFHQTAPGGDVGGFSGGPGGGGGASLRLGQYSAPHPPPAVAPQPPQGPPQLRQQQAPPHNATPAPVPHSQHHTHTHATLTQHSQHHQVLQSGGVGGHGTGGVGTGVGQVGVPPGPSPAPPGPPHDINTQTLPPGSTQQIQQGSGGSLPVASAHNMMYSGSTQNQPQGPQGNAQGQFYPHPGGPSAPPHLPTSGQPRQVPLSAPHTQHMQNLSVYPTNLMHIYPGSAGNVVYISPFQPVPHQRPQAPHSGQYHAPPMPQPHPQPPYQGLPYHQTQGGKHDGTSTPVYRQPQGVFYPPPPQPTIKSSMNQAPQRERKLLAIVDPTTGKNILDDMNNEKPDKTPTPPQSSESSARNTPAPSATPPTKTESAAIAAKFAEEVAKKAAEKDIDTETTDHIARTIKQSDSSSSTVIISDSKGSREKLNNSIGNTAESVNSSLVDSGIAKTVSETEVLKSKQQQPQDSQQMPIQQFTQITQLQQQHLPQQSVQPSVQQLQQMSQPPVQPSLQQLQQHPIQIPQMPPQSVQQLQQASQQVHQQPPPPQQQQQQLQQQQHHNQQQQPQPQPQSQPQKQKSPVPQQPGQQQTQPPVVVQQSPPVLQPQPPIQSPQQTEVPLPPQPQQQQQQQQQPPPQLQPAQKLSDNVKTESNVKPQVQAQSEKELHQTPSKPEPQLPAKQSTSTTKPAVPTPSPKEKEPVSEQQSVQGKRGKTASREETTPARDAVDDSVAQPPQQPLIPPQPQKAATLPGAPQQTANKNPVQSQNTKDKEKKEKTPEPPVPPQPVPQKGSPPSPQPPPPPAVKEITSQPAPSPSLPEEQRTEPLKEREVNNVECGVNVNEEKEDEKKDEGPQLKYNYKENQWSPLNPEGKRQYDRGFLLELQNNPLSLKKPESLPNLEVVRDGPGRSKAFDTRGPMAHGGGPDFTPDYVKSSMSNKQPRMVGRNSQQRRDPGGQPSRGGGGRGQSKIIIIQSTGREPKLKTAENAWKPSVKDTKKSDDPQKAQTDEVVKVMRGILNKLTPEKFEKLVDTVKTMPINTTERLSAVIDLIFEKAVDEQSFSSTYAQMCHVLSLMSVRGNGNEGSSSGKSEVKFRNLIINKCQKEFEKDNTDEFKSERQKEIDACGDPEKKLEMVSKLDYDETKMRKRSVGNIRFIGELYKLRMLTSPIMMRIIGTLLERGDEESLECLCKLLTTIGKILETHCSQQAKAMSDLDKYFKLMEKIVNERQTISRVRFLMMDVIDLRQNNWVPRREDNKPKTKAQVQEEVKREEIEQQIALASNTNRRDDRDRRDDRGRRNRDNRMPQLSEDGWAVASTKGRTFDSSRLKNTFNRPGTVDNKEVQLRGTGFSSWARGSSGGGLKDHDEGKQQESNRFNVLMDSMGSSALPVDNRRAAASMGGPRLAPGGGSARQGGFGSKSMPPPSNDKESAISAVKKLVGTGKSTSRPESRDNSVPRENVEALRGYPSIDADTADKMTVAIIDEYTHNCDPEEAKLCIKEKFAPSTIKYFVQSSLEWVIDRDSKKRKMVGELFHDLLVENLLTVEQLLEGSQDTLGLTEDYVIDIPQVCDYLGEIFAPCLVDNAVSLKKMLDLASCAGNKRANVFACIVSQAAMIMGPNKVADLWNTSGLNWGTIVPPSIKVEDFLQKHRVEFTVDRSKSCSQGGWTPQKVEAEFLKLFKRASNDEIFGWIDAHIGNDAKSSKFIRALVTALVESQATTSNDGSSIRVAEDFEAKMKNRLAVVLKYVDSNETLEMQCIYALQALSVKHQHPPGLLEKCFNAFYDSEVVSEEAFEEWAKSQDPEEQEGKGVCVNSVKNFMRWLKEAEVEEGETHA